MMVEHGLPARESSPETGPASEIARLRARIEELERDNAARHGAGWRTRLLADASATLAGSLDVEQTLAAVARLAVPLLADWCIVDLVSPAGEIRRIAAAHADPTLERSLREMIERYPPDPQRPHPAVHVVSDAYPRLHAEIDDALLDAIAQDAAHRQLLEAVRPRSGLTVPLVARGRVLGAIELVRSRPGWRFADEDAVLVEELARGAALAVDNAMLYHAARETLQRSEEARAILETVLDTAPIGFAYLDRELRYVMINDVLASFNGAPVSAHIGRTLREARSRLADEIEPLLRQVIETGEPVIGLERRGSSDDRGDQLHLLSSYFPIRLPAGDIIGVGALIVDISERRRIESRLRFLAEASELLATSLDEGDTLARVARLAVPFLADGCLVYLRDADGAIRRHAVVDGSDEHADAIATLQSGFPLDPDAASGAPYVIRTGQPLFVAHATPRMLSEDVVDPDALEQLVAPLEACSWMCVPLTTRERTIGAISFITGESRRIYTEHDLALALDLGRRVAVAVENAMLYRVERETREYAERTAERISRLQAVTDALSRTITAAEVAGIAVEQVTAALGARRATLGLLDSARQEIEVIASVGYPSELLARYPRLPLDGATPMADAVRLGEPVIAETGAEYARLYPQLDTIRQQLGTGALVALPLVLGDRKLGAIGVSFSGDQAIGADERAFLLAIARQCAQALERAMLFEASQRQAARMALLADASRSFAAASLDLQEVMTTVAQRVAEAIGDGCLIWLVEPESGSVSRATFYQRDARSDDALREMLACDNAGVETLLARGELAAGGPVLLDAASSPEFLELFPSDCHDAVEQLGLDHALAIALRVPGRTSGVMLAIRASASPPFSSEDREGFHGLADRAALAIENARLYREARDAIRSREQFLSIASHELKTPLTSIKASAQLLGRRFHDAVLDRERMERLGGQMLGEINRLETLVNDLLDASRVQQGRLDLRREPTDVTELARLVLERFDLAPERGHHHRLILDAPQPVVAQVDPARMDQVLTNLVSNALKYSPDGGEVRVTLRASDSDVILAVGDDGIGIPEQDQQRLFEPFARGEQAREAIGGTGLGLFISAEIVERHGGTIVVESAPGHGSTFTVRLPRGVAE